MSVYDFAVWYLWAVPLLTVAGIVALIVYMSLKWPSLPKPLRGFELVKPLLERLLKQGLQSGTLTIRHKKSSKAIEFRKYIRAKNNYGVALSFPETERSREAFAVLKSHCEDDGILHRIGPAGDGSAAKVLWVDCGHDLDKALNLATRIWTKIFRLTVQAPCVVKLRACDVWCDLVDSPNHDLTISIRTYNQRQKQEGGFTIFGAFLGAALVLMLLTALFGLPIATIASLGAPPDWSLGLGSMTASGSTGSLTFACLFLASYAAIQFHGRPQHKGLSPWTGKNNWLKRIHTLGHLALVALMASVVFVWLSA